MNKRVRYPRKILQETHDRYIAGSYEGDIVYLERVKICRLTRQVSKTLGLDGMSYAYITTRALKHLYEKRPAAEYQLILDKLHSIVKRPREIYSNKVAKRGSHFFVGKIREQDYICCVEIVSETEIEVTTTFEARDRYLKSGCVLLRSWGDGTTSHRIALDAN